MNLVGLDMDQNFWSEFKRIGFGSNQKNNKII
jgi:hypothetical protein